MRLTQTKQAREKMSDLEKVNKVEQLIASRAEARARIDVNELRSCIANAVGATYENNIRIYNEIKKNLPNQYNDSHVVNVLEAIYKVYEQRKIDEYSKEEVRRVRDMLAFMERETV